MFTKPFQFHEIIKTTAKKKCNFSFRFIWGFFSTWFCFFLFSFFPVIITSVSGSYSEISLSLYLHTFHYEWFLNIHFPGFFLFFLLLLGFHFDCYFLFLSLSRDLIQLGPVFLEHLLVHHVPL